MQNYTKDCIQFLLGSSQVKHKFIAKCVDSIGYSYPQGYQPVDLEFLTIESFEISVPSFVNNDDDVKKFFFLMMMMGTMVIK